MYRVIKIRPEQAAKTSRNIPEAALFAGGGAPFLAAPRREFIADFARPEDRKGREC
jgi:hypothetical protein